MHKDVFARINKGTQALLHTEPFTQRNLCTEQFLHRETLTQENFGTKKLVHTDCTKKFLHAEPLPRPTFTHTYTFFSAQKPVFTEVFMHNIFFTGFYTQMPLHRKNNITHRNLCTQHVFTQSVFITRRFCFPFLITYLSCSPSQLYIYDG